MPQKKFTYVPVLLMFLLAAGCGGKEIEGNNHTKNDDKVISLKIENGTSLSYKVSPTELVNYTLDITFRELTPNFTFDFVMTNMDYTKGFAEVIESARKTQRAVTFKFTEGKTTYSDKTIMVLSLEAYRDLLETGRTTLIWEGYEEDFTMKKNEEFKFEKGDGHVVEKVMHCINQNGTKEFWVWKNPEIPLIMKMTGGEFSMELTYWYLPGERP
ncbi:MAG: hypothetical protein MH137_00425 [Flavobacteriales bacterium]|nr:hypothetical protein [Flavobacteriales bacterium]